MIFIIPRCCLFRSQKQAEARGSFPPS
ncbi:rCG56172 [Rattus norvegicus]|uniref:RCG56172 n=1 Tax=Rattus norvegicus TaxID=10116 RepID=A6IBP1_RAT|nr:rCG56172 [Rattus norvegicus]